MRVIRYKSMSTGIGIDRMLIHPVPGNGATCSRGIYDPMMQNFSCH